MPKRTVHLTDELERFVQEKVDSGRYEDPSQVVHAALTSRAWTKSNSKR